LWRVKNLRRVPSFAFPPSAIIKRKPLSSTARRAGWVGCNFDLTRIPADARIPVVTESEVAPEKVVREQFRRVKPLRKIDAKERGWTLDVLNAVRSLGRVEFTNGDAYTLADHLEQLHPDNRHVKDKIRQQLQVLRDLGLLLHVGLGVWRLP
jgi:type II restriction enzyme